MKLIDCRGFLLFLRKKKNKKTKQKKIHKIKLFFYLTSRVSSLRLEQSGFQCLVFTDEGLDGGEAAVSFIIH